MKYLFFTTLAYILMCDHGMYAQNEQLFVEYDFYFYQHTGEFTIESVSDANTNLQTIVRNYNLQTAPGVVENITEKSFIYKDYPNNSMIYQENNHPKAIVHENLNLMEWKLTGEILTIMGYECSKAKTTFRGRDYIVYFTTALPFKVAPWKFYGLPGVVLKVYTNDGKVNISVKSLKIDKDLKTIQNPLKDKKSIPFEKYLEIYTLDQNKTVSAYNAANARGGVQLGFIMTNRLDLITEIDIQSNQLYDVNMKTIKQ